MKWNIAVTKSWFSLKNFYLNAELRGTVEEIAREELDKKRHGRRNSSGCRSVMKLFHIRSSKRKINLSWAKILQLSFTICTIWIHLVLFSCRGKSPALSLSAKNLKDFCSYRDWVGVHCYSPQRGLVTRDLSQSGGCTDLRIRIQIRIRIRLRIWMSEWLTRCQQKISFFAF